MKADTTNLPKIDMFMVCEYIKQSDNFNAAEVRNTKAAMSSRESYGDEAIGYVCLKREQLTKTCILKCKVCLEHRIHSKGYSVTLTVNEEDEKILDVKCHDCAASSEVECYWRRSTLASIRASKKYIELNELKKTNMAEPSLPDNSLFRQNVLKIAEQKQLDSQLSRHNFVLKNQIEISQSDTCTWHELRYGRITASRIRVHEAVHCKTLDGSLVQQIIDNGLFLLPQFPVLGASPNALGDDVIVEIKCPLTLKTFEQFLPSGKINKKCKAQINMQMFACGKKRGLFCVADPNFEESKQVTLIWENYDEDFTNSIIENAVDFWKRYIFPKLYRHKSL
ncbi:hypothetical protein ALC57_01288 [Trachymyrmex cornetzi]|uniref:YqaJ viral recombinase domain-containing protein n=1 Tax=Trachymyrmex cornetzi TaxID=471704 RepID=A0A151JQL6_9HYME|nr:hypothetical protein ALC57_01288 [Trachymyrmex cornetzi]